MCGIIGYYSNKSFAGNRNKKHTEILLALIKESKIRGLHSFGYSFIENRELVTEKFFDMPTELERFNNANSNLFIYHNRYSTSGDWMDPNNNQPIVVDKMSIAMNGVVSQKEKEEFEKEYNVKCKTENDTEIFLQLLKKHSIEEAIKLLRGSWAMLFIKDNYLYAVRNEKRPLHYFELENATFFCSTADIAKRALNINTKELKPYELIKMG
jgi:glucosamine 6-phosphate synthetase-like amidotransferase/phosphosugar isomerase protein